MTRLRILTVGYPVPTDPDVNSIEIFSAESLLDADIVIFDTASVSKWLASCVKSKMQDGTQILDALQERQIRETLQRRSIECKQLLREGKTLICFLSPMETFLGAQSGGKVNSYEFLPQRPDVTPGTGSVIKLTHSIHPFAAYHHALKDALSYRVYFSCDAKPPETYFLVNSANRPVGAHFSIEQGTLTFLPYPLPSEQEKVVAVLAACVKASKGLRSPTPAPPWFDDRFSVPGSKNLADQIEQRTAKISEIERERSGFEKDK